MLIACPTCKSTLNVRDELFGKSVRCGKCNQVLRIPAKVAAPLLTLDLETKPETIEDIAAAAIREAQPEQVESDVLVATLIDDREPAMEDGRQRQQHVDGFDALRYDKFDRVIWPRVPGMAVFAGIIWCLVGTACLVVASLTLIGLNKAPRGSMPTPLVFGACLGSLLYVVFGIAFLVIGANTIRGTAKGTTANGIGSLLIGAWHLFQLARVYSGHAQPGFRIDEVDEALAIGLHSFYAVSLLIAGIISLMASHAYSEMRYHCEKITHALAQIAQENRRREHQ